MTAKRNAGLLVGASILALGAAVAALVGSGYAMDISSSVSDLLGYVSPLFAVGSILCAHRALLTGESIGCLASLPLGIAVLWLLIAPYPIPLHRAVSTEPSPNGKLVAVSSYCPAGLVGVIFPDNPWIYVSIRRVSDGHLIARYKSWGHIPDDARRLMSDVVPWRDSAR